jgi:chromosome segregation ATPase
MDKFDQIYKKIKDLSNTKSTNDNKLVFGMIEALIKKLEREKKRYMSIPSIIRTTKTLNNIVMDLQRDIITIENEINGNPDLLRSMYVNEARINNDLEDDNSTITMAFLTKRQELGEANNLTTAKDKQIQELGDIKRTLETQLADYQTKLTTLDEENSELNKDKVIKANEISKLTNEKSVLEIQLTDCILKSKALQEQSEQLKNDVLQCNTVNDTLVTNYTNKVAELANTGRELDALHDGLNRLKLEKTEVDREIGLKRNELMNKDREISDLNNQLGVHKNVLDSMQTAKIQDDIITETKTKEIQKLETDISNLRTAFESLKSDLDELKLNKIDLERNIGLKQSELADKNNEINDLKKQLEKCKENLQASQKENTRELSEINELKKIKLNLETQLKNCSNENAELIKEIENLKNQLKECRSILVIARDKNKEYDEFHDAAKKKIEQQDSDIPKLQDAIAVLKQNLASKTNELMKQKDENINLTQELNVLQKTPTQGSIDEILRELNMLREENKTLRKMTKPVGAPDYNADLKKAWKDRDEYMERVRELEEVLKNNPNETKDLFIERELWNKKSARLFDEIKHLKVELGAAKNQIETKTKRLENIEKENMERGYPIKYINYDLDKKTGAGNVQGEECIIQ